MTLESSFTRWLIGSREERIHNENSSERDRRIITLSLTAKGDRAARIIKSDLPFIWSLVGEFSEKENDFF